MKPVAVRHIERADRAAIRRQVLVDNAARLYWAD